jgi:hypothetical protein
MRAAHQPPRQSHIGCAGCHDPAVVELLVPTRTLCLTCHTRRAGHNAPRECTGCHFVSDPESFRRHLRAENGQP